MVAQLATPRCDNASLLCRLPCAASALHLHAAYDALLAAGADGVAVPLPPALARAGRAQPGALLQPVAAALAALGVEAADVAAALAAMPAAAEA